MPKHDFEVFPFDAYDGFNCNLWRLKNDGQMPQGPVLLVHGAGVRSNIFNAPNDIPRPLGTNALVTISALTERACKIILQGMNKTISYDFPTVTASYTKPAPAV